MKTTADITKDNVAATHTKFPQHTRTVSQSKESLRLITKAYYIISLSLSQLKYPNWKPYSLFYANFVG